MLRYAYVFTVFSFITIFSALTVHAMATPSVPFEQWLAQIRSEAAQAGVSQQTINVALSDVAPIEKVIELDRKQPEGTQTFAQYKKNIVSAARINKGREMMRTHADLLDRISKQYGVAPQYIVALWGIETNYGGYTGGYNIIPALATLAWEGRRAEFFKKELIGALKIIDGGHISYDRMKGSWAGAMGQNQFMPSSFHNFAVDGNGDGRKDIWTSMPDVFASTANYLAQSGWNDGERWGRAVKVPSGLPESLVDTKSQKTLSEWKAMGITLPNGSALPVVEGMKASLVAPDGLAGPTYLVYNNYRVIMKWNRSTYFATSVGHIADAIAQAQSNG